MVSEEYCIVLDLCVRCFRTKARGECHSRLGRSKIQGFILLLAATVTLGLLGTGDELFRKNQGADARSD